MYKLKELPYDYDSLEPFIDTHTLGLHHKKHQQNYLNKLNELLNNIGYGFKYSLETLSKHITEFDEKYRNDILFNLGGVINHNIYFDSINPRREVPNSILSKKINETFNSYDDLKKQFKNSALSIKGSGYTFLVLDKDKLRIVNLLNQDNPYTHNLIPLIGLDMWEHAYYINYENKKDIYIDNFFDIVNFRRANEIFKIL